MALLIGIILPASYFDGLSNLWAAASFLGSALVAIGLVFQGVRSGADPIALIWLLAKVFLIGIATIHLREWLMRLNDIVLAFGGSMGVDPRTVDEKFVAFISGKTASAPKTSVWDVIWGTKSVGTAIAYALLWLFGWLSWAFQYIVKLIGDILLTAGWALSPVFLSFFMIRPMTGVALKYVIGLVALVCWPFGWVIAAVVTNAMLEAAATASLIPVVLTGASIVGPVLTVLLVGTWMIASSILAPYVTTRILLTGANPALALAQGAGGVAQASLAGGISAGAAVATGGAAVAGVAAAAAAGAITSGVESSARGGNSARTTSTFTGGLRGFYGAGFARRQAAATEGAAHAFSRMASAAESMASSRAEQAEFFREAGRRMNRQQRERAAQPHSDNPNSAAIEIETHARKI